jgi:predicted enzyme related to lactoylglutathione lyase
VIKQLISATIWSEDLNNLLPFYRDVLGLKVGMEFPGVAIMGDDPMNGPALRVGTHSNVHGPNTDPYRHIVAFGTDDIQADCKRLKDAGVEFIEDPANYGQLWVATLKDPEGNLVQLFQYTQ